MRTGKERIIKKKFTTMPLRPYRSKLEFVMIFVVEVGIKFL